MKLNKKGYMLVEIILASVIAFGVGYFMLQMVINLKNKNDDLLVETLTVTDQTIIMNKLMEYAKSDEITFSCDNLTNDGNVIKYGDEVIDIVNDYADVGEISCDYTDGLLKISIPLEVKQLSDKNFDANFNYSINEEPSSSTENPVPSCVCVPGYDYSSWSCGYCTAQTGLCSAGDISNGTCKEEECSGGKTKVCTRSRSWNGCKTCK